MSPTNVTDGLSNAIGHNRRKGTVIRKIHQKPCIFQVNFIFIVA